MCTYGVINWVSDFPITCIMTPDVNRHYHIIPVSQPFSKLTPDSPQSNYLTILNTHVKYITIKCFSHINKVFIFVQLNLLIKDIIVNIYFVQVIKTVSLNICTVKLCLIRIWCDHK